MSDRKRKLYVLDEDVIKDIKCIAVSGNITESDLVNNILKKAILEYMGIDTNKLCQHIPMTKVNDIVKKIINKKNG